MSRGGRPTDLVWQYFHKIEQEGKHYAKCKNCGTVRANRVDRMKTHMAQCLKKESTTMDCTENIVDVDKPEIEVANKKVKLNSFVIRTSTDIAHKLDTLVAQFFYANNIPFNVVEHPTFKNMVSALRPGYSPPTRKALSNSLLDEVSTEIKEVTKEKLKGKKVTLVEDGWSNIHNESVIATCIHSEGQAYFLDAIEAGATTKNADFHKQVIENGIKKAKDEYFCDVKAVVTDNAKVMEKTRELLTDNENDLLLYGCSAHWLNLVGQALTPEAIIKQVVKIQKYFRNCHFPAGLLKEFSDSLKPQLPGDTRWNSQLACINTFLKNRQFYIQIAETHEAKIDGDICRLVNDYNLFKQCKDLLSMLQPVAVGLDNSQKDNCSLADVCEIWLSLIKEVSLQPHTKIIENRMKEILKPFHFLAYILHPMYKGKDLSDEQSESARIWAEQKVSGCLTILISFEGEASPFPPSYFSQSVKNMDPVTWWKAIRSKCDSFKSGPAADFVQLAIQLLSCPASSAAIERMFSSFGLIHSKVRNRLGTEKCSKLVMCYRMLRGATELDY